MHGTTSVLQGQVLAAGARQSYTLTCEPGEVAITGFVRRGEGQVRIGTSAPAGAGGPVWVIRVANIRGSASTFDVGALCVPYQQGVQQ